MLLITGALIVLSVIAVRFGADSRECAPAGWFERPH
jgi:hypothetical protein